ncbi:hypothetical protein F5I97DRAFT_640604 [Phlebopus sp. FC_14]|nr:hypothetical protein F5I97DRAFT_640604 [Phlebopus sp. FC_14]
MEILVVTGLDQLRPDSQWVESETSPRLMSPWPASIYVGQTTWSKGPTVVPCLSPAGPALHPNEIQVRPTPYTHYQHQHQHQHLTPIQNIQILLRRLRADPELSQETLFQHYAPAFIFACVLLGGAAALKLGVVASMSGPVLERGGGSGVAVATVLVLVLVSVLVFALLVLLRVIIWAIACAVDVFVETEWEEREEERDMQLDTRSLLFGGIFP